ncbi:MAG: hypothetical protein SRB2_03088 [Desulfobacteraceae bacterium Eth-SRB2]|nr:MAG: hypothetical protein SRB2_03088 [Desulfobacteraceae bacterium Eth-SRB2]
MDKRDGLRRLLPCDPQEKTPQIRIELPSITSRFRCCEHDKIDNRHRTKFDVAGTNSKPESGDVRLELIQTGGGYQKPGAGR